MSALARDADALAKMKERMGNEGDERERGTSSTCDLREADDMVWPVCSLGGRPPAHFWSPQERWREYVQGHLNDVEE